MLTRPRAVDDETVRVLDLFGIAVARDVPHRHFVALADALPVQLGVAQRGGAHVHDRRLVADDLRHHFGIRRNFAYSSGNWFRNHSPPLIELRVVSLPPTINSSRLPMNSCGREGRSCVSSPCASIEIRSNLGVCFCLIFQTSAK